jgi:hypothetical protein
MAEESGTGQVEGLRQEEERTQKILAKIIPNKHDLMVMAVLAIVIGVVFWAGWEMNPTLTCKVWLGEQLHEYYLNESIDFCNASMPFNLTKIS